MEKRNLEWRFSEEMGSWAVETMVTRAREILFKSHDDAVEGKLDLWSNRSGANQT